jgi:hypothetical protein
VSVRTHYGHLVVKPRPAAHSYVGDGIPDDDGNDRCGRCNLPLRNRIHQRGRWSR